MKHLKLEDLAKFVTEDRKKKIEHVLSSTVKGIIVVLDDIYQRHNISAVLRTCDNLGIQDVHVFKDNNKIDLSKGISLGPEKWVDLYIKDKNQLRLDWYKKSIKNLKVIIKNLMK